MRVGVAIQVEDGESTRCNPEADLDQMQGHVALMLTVGKPVPRRFPV